MYSEERLAVLNKIKEFEKNQEWNKDVEPDPESKVLLPNKVDYLGEKLTSKIKTKIANRFAVLYYEKLIKNGDFVIKDILGLENYRSVKGGAILTCNHFSPLDNYAVYRAIRKDLGKRRLYKIIKEGNYTSYKGLFGFFFRNCNTLPLSSNMETMRKFMFSVSKLLNRGEKILIYPEQSMWWNYKKPRPLKNGAFRFAIKNKVPIIPIFITMEDTEKIGADGFKVQAYTLHFLKPIYPNANLNVRQNQDYMAQENYKVWENVYQTFYKRPLVY